MSSTCAFVCAGVKDASMPITWRARPSAAKPTSMPAWAGPVGGKAGKLAGMGGAVDGPDHDVAEGKADFFLLPLPLLGEANIAEPAIFVHGCAGRNRVGLAAGGLHLLDGALPALADADVK